MYSRAHLKLTELYQRHKPRAFSQQWNPQGEQYYVSCFVRRCMSLHVLFWLVQQRFSDTFFYKYDAVPWPAYETA